MIDPISRSALQVATTDFGIAASLVTDKIFVFYELERRYEMNASIIARVEYACEIGYNFLSLDLNSFPDRYEEPRGENR